MFGPKPSLFPRVLHAHFYRVFALHSSQKNLRARPTSDFGLPNGSHAHATINHTPGPQPPHTMSANNSKLSTSRGPGRLKNALPSTAWTRSAFTAAMPCHPARPSSNRTSSLARAKSKPHGQTTITSGSNSMNSSHPIALLCSPSLASSQLPSRHLHHLRYPISREHQGIGPFDHRHPRPRTSGDLCPPAP